MLATRIIPCLDVERGRVVKGTKFLDLVDAGDPVEVAARYEAEGADELVFLDITASHEGRDIMLDVVRRVSETVFMPFTVGGGIRTLDDACRLVQAGARLVDVRTPRGVREWPHRPRIHGALVRHRGTHRGRRDEGARTTVLVRWRLLHDALPSAHRCSVWGGDGRTHFAEPESAPAS